MEKRIPLPAYMPDQYNNSGVFLEGQNVYAAAGIFFVMQSSKHMLGVL